MKIWSFSVLYFIGFLTFCQIGLAAPAQVVIIRHAEKNNNIDPNLSPRGRDRANALISFFLTNPELASLSSPIAIFATEPKTAGSLRPIQTVTPLAEAIGINVNHDFTKEKILAMADYIMKNSDYNGYTVIISSVHDSIPALTAKFGYLSAPTKWKANVFDRAWILKFSDNKVISFKNIPQHLLPGDSLN